MTKASIEILFTNDLADDERETASQLVEQIGTALVAAVDAQIASNRPATAVTVQDGFYVSATTAESAVEQGHQPKAEYVFLVALEHSEFAKQQMKRIKDHPQSIEMPFPNEDDDETECN